MGFLKGPRIDPPAAAELGTCGVCGGEIYDYAYDPDDEICCPSCGEDVHPDCKAACYCCGAEGCKRCIPEIHGTPLCEVCADEERQQINLLIAEIRRVTSDAYRHSGAEYSDQTVKLEFIGTGKPKITVIIDRRASLERAMASLMYKARRAGKLERDKK